MQNSEPLNGQRVEHFIREQHTTKVVGQPVQPLDAIHQMRKATL